MTDAELQTAIAAVPYFYHRIELRPGIVTPGWAPICDYPIPADLTGKAVLDVGSWDGYWTWEALKRGASFVQAIDDFSDEMGPLNAGRKNEWHTWDLCRDALGYTDEQCKREELSVYKAEWFCRDYDVILFFGILYHLKHPLLALEKLRSVCRESIYIETAILDGMKSPYSDYVYTGDECCAEFYPGSEYGQNPSNWWVPTLRCAEAMVETAGFRVTQSAKIDNPTGELSMCRGFINAVVK